MLLCPHGLSCPSQVLGQHSRLAEGGRLKTFLKPAQLCRSVLNIKLATELHRNLPVQTWFTEDKKNIMQQREVVLGSQEVFNRGHPGSSLSKRPMFNCYIFKYLKLFTPLCSDLILLPCMT